MDMVSDAIKQVDAAHSEMSARIKTLEDLAANEARCDKIALAAETVPGEARTESAALAKAAKARTVAALLAERGAVLDAALNQARQAYHAFQNDLRELATLGAPTPPESVVDVNSRRALDSAIRLFHIEARPIPLLERASFDQLCCSWSRPSERWAAEILDAAVEVI